MAPVDVPTDEELRTANYFIRVTQIFFCAMYAIVIWDWLVCLRREYYYIWKRTWTLPSFLYIGCRYWILIIMPLLLWINSFDGHTAKECATLYNLPPLLSMWNQLFAEGVLLVRTHAFFGQNRIVLASLVSVLSTVAIYQLYVGLAQMAPLPFVNPPLGPCLPTVRFKGSGYVMGWFLAPLLFDTLVTVMTIWKAFRMQKAAGAIGSPILQIFLREGLFYFILISIANLVNGVFNVQPNPALSALVVPLSLVFPDVLACRLILDLRQQGTLTPPNTMHQSTGTHPQLSGHHGSAAVRQVNFTSSGRSGANTPSRTLNTPMEMDIVAPTLKRNMSYSEFSVRSFISKGAAELPSPSTSAGLPPYQDFRHGDGRHDSRDGIRVEIDTVRSIV